MPLLTSIGEREGGERRRASSAHGFDVTTDDGELLAVLVSLKGCTLPVDWVQKRARSSDRKGMRESRFQTPCASDTTKGEGRTAAGSAVTRIVAVGRILR